MKRTGKAQRALNRAHDHRDAIEEMLADPWTRKYLRESAIDWFEGQLRKNRFYIYSKDEHRVLAEIIDEMQPVRGFGGMQVGELIDLAASCRADVGYIEDEAYIDELVRDRPTELPVHHVRRLASICRLRFLMPRVEWEYPLPIDPGNEEIKRERAEAAIERRAFTVPAHLTPTGAW